MNFKMIFNTTGTVIRLFGFFLLIPLIVSLAYCEWWCAASFAITAAIAIVLGYTLTLTLKPDNNYVFAKEGFMAVALSWISASLIGALPFVIEGSIPSYIDALFETVSGITTTGSTILTGSQIEALPHGLQFWRSFIQWVGGMGILVFVVAISPKDNSRTMHVLKAEMPGPVVDKLVPKARKTAVILYLIYMVMTAMLFLLLFIGGLFLDNGMNAFESLLHSFTTASTGGFGTTANSLADFNDYSQWVVAIFMLLFGVNFNLYYLIILGKFKSAIQSRELWLYIAIVLGSIVIIALSLIGTGQSAAQIILDSTFQVSSFVTTTGFATVNFNADWPNIAKMVLFLLMFIGGCAGSTAGGFKMSRVLILGKKIGGDLKRALHPRTTYSIKLEGKKLNEEALSGVGSYLALCIVILIAAMLLISFDPNIPASVGLETNISTVVSCFNNIGPGFGLAEVGGGCFAVYSPFSKLVLTITMLFGRLEVYPLLLLILPSTWLKK
jgi:trk system potassium uptake protein TrkH